MGISFELSVLNNYFGNDTSSTPGPVLNYLSALTNRIDPGHPLRLRIGGNSMDSGTYNPSQSAIIQFTDPHANVNDQPVSFGPTLLDVIKRIADDVGAQCLIGLSLRNATDPMTPVLAAAVEQKLGNRLDAFLLGNEPDLYTAHGQRPGLANYTVTDYVQDFSTASKFLENTSAGNLIAQANFAGPTICCNWDLATTLQQGWLSTFSKQLKYITLQHYPQNNCGGKPAYTLDYYLHHANAVALAQWQMNGIQYALSSSSPKPVIMDEFNSASCGGIPLISNTFGAALWTVDYALQMASVGYSAAYLHTREPGITYNLFDPSPSDGGKTWTTGPPYYAFLPITEALNATAGSLVVDLDLQNSMTDTNATVAGYAVYASDSHKAKNLLLINFSNTTAQGFALGQGTFSNYTASQVVIKYLIAPSVNEATNIAWAGESLAGVGDGLLTQAKWSIGNTPVSTWATQQIQCDSGCTITVPGPAAALISLDAASNTSSPSASSSIPSSSLKHQTSPTILSVCVLAISFLFYQ